MFVPHRAEAGGAEQEGPAAGTALRDLGRYEEAESQMIAAFPRQLPLPHRETVQTVESLVRLYEATGRADVAKAWRAKLGEELDE